MLRILGNRCFYVLRRSQSGSARQHVVCILFIVAVLIPVESWATYGRLKGTVEGRMVADAHILDPVGANSFSLGLNTGLFIRPD